MIRVESEETQDYVLETQASALSESRGATYWCDNRRSEEVVGNWQMASMVVEEGGEAHTINFVLAVLQRTVSAVGQAATESVAMERSSGEDNASRENLESDAK